MLRRMMTATQRQPVGRAPVNREEDRELVALVLAARRGDQQAWSQLVVCFDAMLRCIARSYRLAPADADDAMQATWLKLFETIHRLREPAAISGWLSTTMRRTALRSIQSHVREVLTDDLELGDGAAEDRPEQALLARERREILGAAIARLPERQRDLVGVLLAEPSIPYQEIGELTAMPIGSIGPIRARSFARLARDEQLRAVSGL
jgi:RNA polymerase sigma factor (sigma-70 family)